MTDINTTIAVHCGWILNPSSISSEYEPSVKWYNPKTGEKLYTHEPDYLNDARLYMALFEEMWNPGLRKHGLQWYCCPNMNASSALNHIAVYSDTIGTAICLAYCKLHGLE